LGRKAAKTEATAGPADPAPTFSTEILGRHQRATLITMDDLEEFQGQMKDEFWQFSLGEFFAAGAFWLLIARITSDVGADTSVLKDLSFWIGIFGLILGAVVGYFGLKQLDRRKKKIQRHN